MPAPTNISGATAVALSLDVPVTQNVHDAGTTYDVWYKYTAVAGDNVVGVFAFGGLDAYQPILTVSASATGTPLLEGMSISHNRPVTFPVTAGTTYYLKVVTNDTTVTPASLTIDVKREPHLAVPAGSIWVNDDAWPFPAAIFSHINGSQLTYKTNMIADEVGAVLPVSGRVLLNGATDTVDGFVLYDNQLDEILEISFPSNVYSMTTDGVDTFYVAYGSPVKIQRIDQNGTLFGTVHTVTGYVNNIAVNRAETILYYAQYGGDTTIKRFDLVGDVALTDFLPDETNLFLRLDMLNLDDDTIIIPYRNTVDSTEFIRRYNAAGTLLNTYNMPSTYGINHMAYAIDDPDSFWVWMWSEGAIDDETTNRFVNIKVSDGSYLHDVYNPLYWNGVYDHNETATPTRWGHSGSCFFLILRAALGGVTPSTSYGLFKIVPDKRTDHDGNAEVKIPNPTFKTGLIP